MKSYVGATSADYNFELFWGSVSTCYQHFDKQKLAQFRYIDMRTFFHGNFHFSIMIFMLITLS